jgi:hypothetical protein
MLKDSELQSNNANLVQQVVNGMQEAMVNDTNTEDNAEMLLQMSTSATLASETQKQLNNQIQQMQQSMNLLQAQVANQQSDSFQPYNGYQGHQGYQGQNNGGYQNQGYQGQQQNQVYQGQHNQGHQGGGYQGCGYQGRGYQGRGGRGYTKVVDAATKGVAPTVNATPPSIVGLMAAVDILATIATPNSMGTRTIPLSRIKWAAAQEIVSLDMLGPRKKII